MQELGEAARAVRPRRQQQRHQLGDAGLADARLPLPPPRPTRLRPERAAARPAVDLPAFVDHADHLLAEVLGTLELDDAHLVVSSLGAYHGLRTAAAHPERVRRMVAVCFPFGATCGPLPVVMRVTGFRRLGRIMADLPKPKRAVRSMMGQIGLRQALDAGRVSELGITWFWSLLNHTDTMRNDIDSAPSVILRSAG